MSATLSGLAGRLALLVFGAVLAAGAAELAVLLAVGEQAKFPRHVVAAPWGLRFNEPGAAYRHKSADLEVWLRINPQGMRADRPYAVSKPAGVARVVSLGDSFTIGYEVEAEQTFSHVLERELSARGICAEVLNAGVSGFGTAEELVYLERELWKYAPDLVLVSFFVNDFGDNVRSNLFRLDDAGNLQIAADQYVPAGRLGDFLNRNALLGWLSGYSNAFVLAKERANDLMKGELERQRETAARSESGSGSQRSDAGAANYERRLTLAILERLYQATRAKRVPLVIQSIPSRRVDRVELVETFPSEFERERESLYFFAAKAVLEPHRDRELLYWERSHGHWTPFAHARAGEGLAELIAERALLPVSAESSGCTRAIGASTPSELE